MMWKADFGRYIEIQIRPPRWRNSRAVCTAADAACLFCHERFRQYPYFLKFDLRLIKALGAAAEVTGEKQLLVRLYDGRKVSRLLVVGKV